MTASAAQRPAADHPPQERHDRDAARLRAALAECVPALTRDAARLEHGGVERPVLDRLGAAGLLALFGPPDLGGVGPALQREAAELLAGASPDAWFVWFQHGPVVKMLAASENADLQRRHLGALCQGTVLGGVAWSNLRTPRPSVLATRVEGGWQLDGPQPWCTGWDLIDVVLVGGLVQVAGEADRLVFGILPRRTAGLRSAGALQLAAMGGTTTHAVRYDAVLLPDEDVVLLTDAAEFGENDRARNANVQPSTFGIALAALDLLGDRNPAAADPLRERVLLLRSQAYALLDEVHPAQSVQRRLTLRSQALLLALECCTALLAARGGQGMDLAEPAQRLLRAAAFQLVHSQDAAVRQATLAQLSA